MKIIKTAGYEEIEKIINYKKLLLEIDDIIKIARTDPEMAIKEMLNLDIKIRVKQNEKLMSQDIKIPWNIIDFHRMKNISSDGLVNLFEKLKNDFIKEMKEIKEFKEEEQMVEKNEPYQTVPLTMGV